jgi:hypothetical protein
MKYDNGFPSTGVNAWAREKGQERIMSLGIPIRQLVCSSEGVAMGRVNQRAFGPPIAQFSGIAVSGPLTKAVRVDSGRR